jgi:hypothetical protein
MKLRGMRISWWITTEKKTKQQQQQQQLGICHTYCFSTATMVKRTRRNVTLIRTLLVLLHSIWAKVRKFSVTSRQYYTKFWVTIVFWYVTPCSMVHRYQCFWETSLPFHQTIRRHIAEDHNLNCGHYLRGPLTELLFLYCNNSAISSSAGLILFDVT